MATLWEIDEAITNTFDVETGEILDEALLDSLTMEREQKLENLCKWVKNLEADAEAYKQYKQDFAAKQKHAENKANSIKNYIKAYLDGQKWESPDKAVSVRYRTTKDKVIVDDLTQIPDSFFKLRRTEDNLNKTAVKEYLLSEVENGSIHLEGVHLEDSVSMSIK